MPGFLILTTADLPEAYFLAASLESRGQRLAMVNIVARPVSTQIGVLARLRRNRGTVYLADLLLARTGCAGCSTPPVTEGVGGGDVTARRPVPMWGESSLAGYLGRLQREASDGFVEVIAHVLDGAPLTPIPQAGTGRYFPPAGWSVRRQAERNFAHPAALRAVAG